MFASYYSGSIVACNKIGTGTIRAVGEEPGVTGRVAPV